MIEQAAKEARKEEDTQSVTNTSSCRCTSPRSTHPTFFPHKPHTTHTLTRHSVPAVGYSDIRKTLLARGLNSVIR